MSAMTFSYPCSGNALKVHLATTNYEKIELVSDTYKLLVLVVWYLFIKV